MNRNATQIVTVALANHRPETVAPAARLMAEHEALFLEEPPSEELDRMLSGDLSVEAYLQAADAEYPEFGRQMALRLRQLHKAGKKIVAVEPFLEHLLGIHEFFAEGGTPAEIEPGTDRSSVYAAERDATGALLDFYRAAASASFEETVAAVKRFARQDARRFLLRDRMRAETLAGQVRRYRSSYVEAGQIHYYLWQRLRRQVAPGIVVTPRFLMAPAVRALGTGRHLYGPGDILTLLYVFHPGFDNPLEDLLAARSLIYNKLIAKNEMGGSEEAHPHTRDELATAAIVKRLTLADCRYLFPFIRRMDTLNSVKLVHTFLDHKGADSFL